MQDRAKLVVKSILTQIENQLTMLNSKDAKNFDGTEITMIAVCDTALRLLDSELFDKHDYDKKQQLLALMLALENKYAPPKNKDNDDMADEEDQLTDDNTDVEQQKQAKGAFILAEQKLSVSRDTSAENSVPESPPALRRTKSEPNISNSPLQQHTKFKRNDLYTIVDTTHLELAHGINIIGR